MPGNAWGSVVGNALERGFSAAGDHSATWPLFRNGFGPSWDQMFVQSNYGIVTKMCLWMKPEVEAFINVGVPAQVDVLRVSLQSWTEARNERVRGALVRVIRRGQRTGVFKPVLADLFSLRDAGAEY